MLRLVPHPRGVLMRYTDKNVSLHREDDFVTRQRLPTLAQFIILFTINYIVVSGAYLISQSFLQFALITILMLGITDSIMVWTIQRSRDLVLVTEFQNALFAGALSMQSHFSLIVRRDGIVVYTDMGFRTMYPNFERSLHSTVEEVFHMAGVKEAERGPVIRMITKSLAGSHTITMKDGDGKLHKMMVYVEPLRRPSDYALVRGRPFVEKRAVEAPAA